MAFGHSVALLFLLLGLVVCDQDAEVVAKDGKVEGKFQRQRMRYIPVSKSGPNGFEYRGTIWESGWVPVSPADLSPVGDQVLTNSGRNPYEARQYASRFFPHLKKNSYRLPSPVAQRPYGAIGSYYGGPKVLQEVVAQCEQTRCYVGCRKSLLGGGRCTRGGCLCYAAFFDHTGAPTSMTYPEDQIWFSLPDAEKQEIWQVWHSNRPAETTPTPSTGRPDYYMTTTRPHHRHHHTTAAPTETSRPNFNQNDNKERPNKDWWNESENKPTEEKTGWDNYEPPESEDSSSWFNGEDSISGSDDYDEEEDAFDSIDDEWDWSSD